MDPVGPWSAYASYNRLAGVQASSTSGELHHHLTSASGAPATTTAQLLPGSFLSPPPVGYETVFSPLFHGAKPAAHYVSQHRAQLAASKQSGDTEYHPQQAFFEQGGPGWQQNSPFGILPHESVVPTTNAKTYENFNAHFAAAQSLNHLNSQIVAAKAAAAASRAQSPQVSAATSKSGTFFQVPTTFAESTTATTKAFPSITSNVQQQSCIVTSPSVTPVVTKEYHRLPQNRVFLNSPTRTIQTNKQQITSASTTSTSQIQTKAQTKIYPELSNERTRNDSNDNQTSPISFSIMDVPGRINYSGSNSSSKRQFHNYRQYQNTSPATTMPEQEFQRPKSGSDYTNNTDCSVVVPRRPSPLQAHSQPGHAPSPVYPMYNSPMNSSPQSSSNQIAPPSPLDVSVPRVNAQQTNIAYPSVITRALNNTERPNQNCWDERRKFNNNNYANETRQQYFDNTNQVTLQDLSSCRGDPMSLVKNLQQQQSCQVEIKQEIKPLQVKRRKSGDKNDTRIPPPAHNQIQQPQQQQQQQNGAYFDFDRWNLPTPTSKMFNQHSQMMSHHHHHPPPPIPYFAPFLPHHPTSEFELSQVNYEQQNYQQPQQQQQQQQQQQPQQQDDQPKVVVPNIEEELNFLSQTKTSSPIINKPIIPNAVMKQEKTGSTGFMSSYLKFLQGERDGSPPPITRNHRKQSNWARIKPQSDDVKVENGQQSVPAPLPLPPQPVKRLSQGDPQDDPRYFPLPKERKRDSFDSSEDGLSSDDDFFGNKKNFFSTKDTTKTKKTRQKYNNNNNNNNNNGDKRRFNKIKDDLNLENIPRRESVKRAAKEKNNLLNLMKTTNDDDLEEPIEYQDSDSDPAWTPQAKDDNEEIVPVQGKKIKRGRPRSKKKRNLITAAAQGAGIQDLDGYNSDSSLKKTKQKVKQNTGPPTLEDNIAASLTNTNVKMSNEDITFTPGVFVVIKSELNQEWPAIWRVDGKTLLQKYEPFEQNGSMLYKNISTYTSWTPESKKQYMPIPVRFKIQNQTETIVEFLRKEVTIIDNDYHEKCMKECEIYQDNFEVYIQTLISQALDSNFLTEIFQEKDEYFLSNVKIIDDITDSKKRKLLNLLKWPPQVQAAVCTWPCFNVIREVSPSDVQTRNCDACNRMEVAVRVLMYGQPYNSTTLEGCQPDPKAMNEKNFLMCRICANRVELSNKVTHQKYLMYIECAKKVAEKRTNDPNKDTTCILNELLADENWLNHLFFEVRTSWAEIDSIEQSLKLKNNSVFEQ